ncbi:hypothetical protein EB796_022087 [Bugula neritina]|uniref:RING-type domain-containing protein n=1 Tax=Bugula neritina TaxID=10212 RepID=A0A7J7J1Q8_BUGNE|nr:hypothetical protein EB796_022087 [Bugula neritina]
MPAHATGLLRSVACPICFKMLKDPTILDCGHTFCCSYTNIDGGDQDMRSPPPQSYSNIEDDNKENTTTCDYIPNNIQQEKPEPSNDEQTPKHESQGFEETHDTVSDESSLTGSIPWWLYPAMTILRDSLLDEWLKLGTLQN